MLQLFKKIVSVSQFIFEIATYWKRRQIKICFYSMCKLNMVRQFWLFVSFYYDLKICETADLLLPCDYSKLSVKLSCLC